MDNDLTLYTLREVEEILKVTQRTLYKYIKEGRLKATKAGNWRVKHSDLMDFVNKGASKK